MVDPNKPKSWVDSNWIPNSATDISLTVQNWKIGIEKAIDFMSLWEYGIYTKEFDEIVGAMDLIDDEEAIRLYSFLSRYLNNFPWREELIFGIRSIIQNFQQEQSESKDALEPCVSLLLDNSWSMRGMSVMNMAFLVNILAEELERANIPFEILWFTTKKWKWWESFQKWLKDGKPTNPGRINDLRHIVYKSYDSKFEKQNLGLLIQEWLLKENIDGEAMIWAYERIDARSENKKVIWQFSDGAPIDDATQSQNRAWFLEDHFKSVLTSLSKKWDLELHLWSIGPLTKFSDSYKSSWEYTSGPEKKQIDVYKILETFGSIFKTTNGIKDIGIEILRSPSNRWEHYSIPKLIPFFHICKDAEYTESFFNLYTQSIMEWDVFKFVDKDVLNAIIKNKWFSIQDWFWKETLLSSPKEFNSLAKIVELFRWKWLYTKENKNFCLYLANISTYELLEVTISLWYDNIKDLQDIIDILRIETNAEDLKQKLVHKRVWAQYRGKIFKSLKRGLILWGMSHVITDWKTLLLTPLVFLFTGWFSAIRKAISYKWAVNKETKDYIQWENFYKRLLLMKSKKKISWEEAKELDIILKSFNTYSKETLKALVVTVTDINIIVKCIKVTYLVDLLTVWMRNFQYVENEAALEDIYDLLCIITSYDVQAVHNVWFEYQIFLTWKSRIWEKLWTEEDWEAKWKSGNILSIWKYYEELDVSRNASKQEVNSAYRKLAKKYHPDNQDTGDADKMRKINDAKDKIFQYKGWE